MKFFRALSLIPTIAFSVLSPAQEAPNFYHGTRLNFKIEKFYRFEMNVVKNTNDKLILESSKVFKGNKFSYAPDEERTPKDSAYQKFRGEYENSESEDDSITLRIDLDDIEIYNDSAWFNKTKLSFREKFVPYSNPIKISKMILDRKNIIDAKKRELYLKNVVLFSSEYALAKPFYLYDIEDGIRDHTYTTFTNINRAEKSQNFEFDANNAPFFIQNITRKSTNPKYVNKFYFSSSNYLASKMYESLIKYSNVTYTYLIQALTNVLPLKVLRADRRFDSYYDWPNYELVNFPETENKGLTCTRKSKTKFTCTMAIAYHMAFKMPGNDEIRKHTYPDFVIEALNNSNFTQEDHAKGLEEIDLNTLKYAN